MDMTEFEKIVNNSVSEIPKKFRLILEKENVKLLAREKAPEPRAAGQNNLIFGVFIGVPYTKRSVFNVQQEPTRIELYKASFEKAFGILRKQEMKKQIVKTVVHEIGHYFGFSEEDLQEYL